MFFSLLKRYRVEQGVQGALQQPKLRLIAAHRVRLPAARDSIRKQKAVLSVEHVLHERQADLLEDLLLGRELVVDLSERVDQLLDLARSVRGRALLNKLNQLNQRNLNKTFQTNSTHLWYLKH